MKEDREWSIPATELTSEIQTCLQPFKSRTANLNIKLNPGGTWISIPKYGCRCLHTEKGLPGDLKT